MKRIFQIVTLLIALGAIVQTAAQAIKKPTSAQNTAGPKAILLAGEPGI